jgi:HK97 family phage major capsid protein
VAQDILDWFWDLPAQFKANAAWSTRSDFMGLITGIGATADGIHMITDLTAAVPENLLGKPIMLADMTGWDNGAAAAADEELGAIGDFRNYIFVDRVGMSLKRDDSIYVNNDQVWFGARKRFDGRVALADAFRILKILS